jgi:F-type H+-transporting ATPase subunit b
MKRRAWNIAVLFAVTAATLVAQEAGHTEQTASKLSPTLEIILLWANFILLAIGLVYLIKKFGGPFFAARSERIQHEIVEGARIRQESEAQSADVDRRLATLESELASIRAESKKELESIERHISAKTTAEIARIQSSAEQEIAGAGKTARLELKRYSAELAVQLAAEKIRAQMTPDAQESLERDFVQDLDGTAARAQAN